MKFGEIYIVHSLIIKIHNINTSTTNVKNSQMDIMLLHFQVKIVSHHSARAGCHNVSSSFPVLIIWSLSQK